MEKLCPGGAAMSAVLNSLEMELALLREGDGTKDRDDAVREYESALAVLRDWPKWEELVGAAGKVNKKLLMPAFESLPRPGASELNIVYNQLRALLAAIPEEK